MALLGAKGEVLFQKRTSPFGTPKRTRGGSPTTPNNGRFKLELQHARRGVSGG